MILAVGIAALLVLSSISTNWGTALGQTGGPSPTPGGPEIIPPTPVGSLEVTPVPVSPTVVQGAPVAAAPTQVPQGAVPTTLPSLLPVTGEYLRANAGQAAAIGLSGIVLIAAGLAARRRWGESKNR